MRIAIDHTTRYTYAASASYGIVMLRMTPAPYQGLAVVEWQIRTEPEGRLLPTRDGFGNATHLLTITTPHDDLEVTATGIVEVTDTAGVVKGLPESVPLRVYLRPTALTAVSPAIEELIAGIPEVQPVPRLHALMNAIRDRVDYVVGATSAQTTAAAAYESGEGVCQDHAHIFIAAARAIDVPARYVTGYLLTEEPAPAHHAWTEAYVEGLGWVGFDPANRLCPTDRYVRLAASLDAHYASPIRGSRRGGPHESLAVRVAVEERASQQQSQSQQQDAQSQSQKPEP